jgi:hypothetical protein
MSNDEITIKNQTGKHFKVKKNSKKKTRIKFDWKKNSKRIKLEKKIKTISNKINRK